MAIRVVRLGSPRSANEGTRIGTVRRPPRGVPKAEHASGDWYDVWLPVLAPSPELLRQGRAAHSSVEWTRFAKRYAAEMAQPEARHVIELLAALSRSADFSVGCYCEDAQRCHRSVLRGLLEAAGATFA